MADIEGVFQDVDKFLSYSTEKAESIVLRGLLREHPDKARIYFSPTLKCDQWLNVEKSAVTKLTHLGQTSCSTTPADTHSHPIALVEFNNSQSSTHDLLKVVRILLLKADKLSNEVHALRLEAATTGQIKPEYVGPCGGNWACQDGSVISCTPGVGRPYENINTNECYCISC